MNYYVIEIKTVDGKTTTEGTLCTDYNEARLTWHQKRVAALSAKASETYEMAFIMDSEGRVYEKEYGVSAPNRKDGE